MKLILFSLISALLTASPLSAGPVLDDPSLIRMNTRIFDLRADVSKLRRDDDFIPLTEIKWLTKLIENDEYLKLTVVHIKERPQPVLRHWYSLEPDLMYPLTKNIPDMFVLDGYQTRSAHPSNRMLLLVPRENPNDFFVTCSGGNIEARRFCAVHATYPPDPNINLLARVYHPEPPFHFREIAHRIREIAYCLDVTEAINAGTYKPVPYVDPDKGLPELRNCYDPIS
jgi:hypothetical protein